MNRKIGIICLKPDKLLYSFQCIVSGRGSKATRGSENALRGSHRLLQVSIFPIRLIKSRNHPVNLVNTRKKLRKITLKLDVQRFLTTQYYVDRIKNIFYISRRLEDSAKLFKQSTDVLKSIIESFLAGTPTTLKDVLDGSYEQKHFNELNVIVETEIKPMIDSVKNFNIQITDLHLKIDGVLNTRHDVTYDSFKLSKFQEYLKRLYPKQRQMIDDMIINNRINVSNVFDVFSLIFSDIKKYVEAYQPINLNNLADEAVGVQDLVERTDYMVRKVNECDTRSKELMTNQSNPSLPRTPIGRDETINNLFVRLQMMVQITPPISLDALKRAECAADDMKWISLLPDGQPKNETKTAEKQRTASRQDPGFDWPAGKRFCSRRLQDTFRNNTAVGKNKLDSISLMQTLTQRAALRPLSKGGNVTSANTFLYPNDTYRMNWEGKDGVSGNSTAIHRSPNDELLKR